MKKKIFLVIVIIIVTLVVFHRLGWIFLLGDLSQMVFQPMAGYLNKTLSGLSELFYSKEELKKENQELKKEIRKLLVENVRLKIVAQENQEIRKELNFWQKENYQFVIASVIGKKSEAGVSWFVLDRGTESGLKEGFPVVTQGIIVGKVVKVVPGFSYFLPLLDSRSRLAATIIPRQMDFKEKTKINGLVKGKINLILEIDYLPSDYQLTANDLVVTSGLENFIPAGLLIGEIRQFDHRPGGLFQKAIVEPAAKVENLSLVTIMRPKF